MATTKVKRDSSSTNTTKVPGKKTLTSNFRPRTNSTTTNSTQKASSISLASTENITSQKQAPNYLKPTKSLRPTSIKHPKNQNIYTNKPTLNRRSFDKLPSSSGSSSWANQKAPERVLSNSSSFLSKTTSSPLSRNLSSSKTTAPPRVTKIQILYGKNAKKSTESFVRKEEVQSKGTCSTHKIVQPDRTVVKVDHDHDDQELTKAIPLGDDHKLIKSEDNVNHDDHDSDIVYYDHDQDIVYNIYNHSSPCDISTFSELVVKADDPDSVKYNNDGIEERSTTVKHNKLDSADQEEEDFNPGEDHDSDQLLLEDSQENMNQNKVADYGDSGILEGDDHVDSKADDKIQVKDKDTNNANGTANEENKITNIGDDNDLVDDHQKEEKHVVEEVARPQGKKESKPYNDLIEETASKLLVKRINKVKALVDAFEIVMDNESK